MSKYFESYFNYMRSNGKSENSIKTYRSDVSSLEKFLNTKGMSIDNNIADLTFEIMMEFKSYLFNKKLSPNTLNRRFRMLKKFFKYMMSMKVVDNNCCAGIEDTNVPERVMIIPTEEEMIEVENVLDNEIKNGTGRCHEYINARNKMIMIILSTFGLRNSELRNLELSSVRKDNMISIIGKGNKERLVWMDENIRKHYREYLEIRKSHLEKFNKNTNLIFFSYRCNKIAVSDLNVIVKNTGKMSGVESLDHAHILRHYTGSTIVRSTGNIRLAQKILGHSKISTTQIYTHIEERDIKDYYSNKKKQG